MRETLINCLLLASIVLALAACTKREAGSPSQSATTDLQVEHLSVWVDKPEVAKQKLQDIGFTIVPDSFSDVHHGQGTSGRYMDFLNMYLELIFVYDQDELERNNKKNTDLDFVKRANFDANGASPFSIALKIRDYDMDKIPFETVRYHQDWMEGQSSIYSAKNSNLIINEPSIFVVYPEMEHKQFERLSDLDTIPEEYAFVGEFYKHKNGAQKLTKISITAPGVDLSTETMKAIESIENITITSGSEHLMELFFDDGVQGESIDLRPELPIIVHL